MKILTRAGLTNPDLLPFDVAERKGLGHPDTLADLIADTFSREYATQCLDLFEAVPNHWVDKVTLIGAASHVAFGSYEIFRPVGCHLIGKVTGQVGDHPILVEEIFQRVVRDVMGDALGGPKIWPHLKTYVADTSGTAVDHDRQFYAPADAATLRRVLSADSVGNDTVICVGSSGPGQAGQLAVWLEEQIRATAPPQIGTDVKVMVVRDRSAFDVTVALPVHPETVASWRDYADVIGEYSEVLSGDLKSRCAATVRVNTKDVPGRGYLAPFGTSLGKGDCGAVGRGNRSYGVIEPLRASSCEAPAGKNPVHHGGKIYSALAGQAARAIADKTGHPAQVTIAARNGEALDDPAYVLVAVADDSDRRLIEDTVREIISAATGYCADFLGTDPITRFRAGRA